MEIVTNNNNKNAINNNEKASHRVGENVRYKQQRKEPL